MDVLKLGLWQRDILFVWVLADKRSKKKKGYDIISVTSAYALNLNPEGSIEDMV